MSGRLYVRPRPLDIQKQLPIIRDVSELDPPAEGGPDICFGFQEDVDKDAKKNTEIPIPLVREISTYSRDYLPVFKRPFSYIRDKGGTVLDKDLQSSYDLESEDEHWLEEFNGDQERLSHDKLEQLLWKLEMLNAEANDRLSAITGTSGLPDRISPAVVAQVGNLKKDDAINSLMRTIPLRTCVLNAVYDLWKSKRIRKGEPLLRCLQAPTATSDNSAYHVFRPREKVHRPQTRRRRENTEDSLEKIKLLRQNLIKAYELADYVSKRELKKCGLVYLEANMQQMDIIRCHGTESEKAEVNEKYIEVANDHAPLRPLHLRDLIKDNVQGSVVDLDRFRNRKTKRISQPTISELCSPPREADEDMLFASAPSCDEIQAQVNCIKLQGTRNSRRVRPRIGRGGRIIFDRCHPFTHEPLSEEDAVDLDDIAAIDENEPFPLEFDFIDKSQAVKSTVTGSLNKKATDNGMSIDSKDDVSLKNMASTNTFIKLEQCPTPS